MSSAQGTRLSIGCVCWCCSVGLPVGVSGYPVSPVCVGDLTLLHLVCACVCVWFACVC